MNRLTKRLADLKKQNKKALVAYLVAGDPDIESTLQLMNLFVESGVDVLEINISLTAIFEMVQKFRETDNTTPIVLMGYLNTFLSHKKIIEENKKDSVDSILVVDIPGELNLADYGIKNQNINTISLISPTTNKDRIKSIANNSTGFVYYVTLRGVTGASNLNIDEITENIEEIKKYASVPTLAGFGIKSPDDARLLSSCSDGVIIGSSIVQMIEESSQSKEFDRIGQYISELKQAIS